MEKKNVELLLMQGYLCDVYKEEVEAIEPPQAHDYLADLVIDDYKSACVAYAKIQVHSKDDKYKDLLFLLRDTDKMFKNDYMTWAFCMRTLSELDNLFVDGYLAVKHKKILKEFF